MCFVLGALKDDPAFCSGSSCCGDLIVADVWVFACWIGKLIRLFVTLPLFPPPPSNEIHTPDSLGEKSVFPNCHTCSCPWWWALNPLDFLSPFETILWFCAKIPCFIVGRMFCWSSVGCVNLFSSRHNNSGRQSHILLAVETVSVWRNFILGGNSGECFLLIGTGLY